MIDVIGGNNKNSQKVSQICSATLCIYLVFNFGSLKNSFRTVEIYCVT